MSRPCPALVPPLSRPCPALVPGLFCATAVLRPGLKPIKIGGVRTPPNKHIPPLSRPCPALPALLGHSSDGTPKYIWGLVFDPSQFLATKGGKGGTHFALWVILRLGPQSHEKVKRPYSANNPVPPFPPLSRPCPALVPGLPQTGQELGAHSSRAFWSKARVHRELPDRPKLTDGRTQLYHCTSSAHCNRWRVCRAKCRAAADCTELRRAALSCARVAQRCTEYRS